MSQFQKPFRYVVEYDPLPPYGVRAVHDWGTPVNLYHDGVEGETFTLDLYPGGEVMFQWGQKEVFKYGSMWALQLKPPFWWAFKRWFASLGK